MAKNVVIVHGCIDDKQDTSYACHWMPWLKETLDSRGISVELPLMPNPLYPSYDQWKRVFDSYSIDEETILIGHSCGAAFLVRWLGETKQRINKLILVAPWKTTEDEHDLKNRAFYDYPLEKTLRERVKEIIFFTADDEGPGGKRSLDLFHKVLGGKIIELKDHGHFTFEDMETEEFPELLQEVLS